MPINFNPDRYTCDDVERFMYEYVERELTGDTLVGIDSHLVVCRECAKAVESYVQSMETVRDTVELDIELPGEVRDDLVKVLQSI